MNFFLAFLLLAWSLLTFFSLLITSIHVFVGCFFGKLALTLKETTSDWETTTNLSRFSRLNYSVSFFRVKYSLSHFWSSLCIYFLPNISLSFPFCLFDIFNNIIIPVPCLSLSKWPFYPFASSVCNLWESSFSNVLISFKKYFLSFLSVLVGVWCQSSPKGRSWK